MAKFGTDEYKRKMSLAMSGHRNPNFGKCGEKHPMFGKPRSEETKKKISLGNTGKILSEETKKKISVSHTGRTLSDDHKKSISLSLSLEKHPNFGKHLSEETRRKIGLANSGENSGMFGKTISEETREKRRIAHTGRTHSEETKQKIRIARTGKPLSEEHKMKLSLLSCDIWYGGVKYSSDRKYCELWNRDLLNRIRSFFGNISVLSGKTKSENNNRNMSCHHVYYQKKACCEWDEDAQGYYAMIDHQKYYIKGDPNKFVTLTTGENTFVNNNKLKWVKIFEDIIESKYGSKCYYTKEEYADLVGGVV